MQTPGFGEVHMIGSIHEGIPTQYGPTLSVDVYYPGQAILVIFQSGPADSIEMTLPGWDEPIVVDNPSRFGPFGAEWIRRFYA